MLGRAGALTPPGLRAAITAAVLRVAPGKAKARREHAAKKTRVERWAEGSGNAGLAGRELPAAQVLAAQVLAADQRVTAWARELRKAGLDGGIDALRARAYLDILLGMDSRPLGSRADGTPGDPAGPRTPAPAGPLVGVIPPGFVGQVNLTVPATTVLDLASRLGELGGVGSIDPDLARDLAEAAARNSRRAITRAVPCLSGGADGAIDTFIGAKIHRRGRIMR